MMVPDMAVPNLFLVGAPKCGTTSLWTWLKTHPQVLMSKVKEPNYFNSDILVDKRYSWPAYLRLFANADPACKWVGEASALYLRSQVAVRNILAVSEGAHFIVCVRNPLDMAISLHAQNVRTGYESTRDFAKAWRLQAVRKRGQCLPRFRGDVGDLIYGEVCLLGRQVKRLMDLVNRERVRVVVFDDLAECAEREYERILEFLGVERDQRQEFRKRNVSRMVPRAISLSIRGLAFMKARSGIRSSFGVMRALERVFGYVEAPCAIPPGLRAQMCSYFRSDVELLSNTLGRDLTHWVEQ